MGKVQEREREGHRVSHRAGHPSRYGAGSAASQERAGRERALKLRVCLENKAGSKAMEAQWKGISAHLERISLVAYGWRGLGALDLADTASHGDHDGHDQGSACGRTAARRCESQGTQLHVDTHTWCSRRPTGTVTSQLHSHHPKTAGEEAAPETNAAKLMGLGENGILSC